MGKILEALEAGGKSTITVVVACGMAGLISGCITATGLASRLISAVVSISNSVTFMSPTLVALLLILVLSSLILTVWIYTSIVTPIYHLQVATKRITQGNLDFELPVGGDDEIGELCTDFEEMRRRRTFESPMDEKRRKARSANKRNKVKWRFTNKEEIPAAAVTPAVEA